MQSQVRFNRICGHLTHGKRAEVFPALGLAARFRKICKVKLCGCWGYHRSLFLLVTLEICAGRRSVRSNAASIICDQLRRPGFKELF